MTFFGDAAGDLTDFQGFVGVGTEALAEGGDTFRSVRVDVALAL